MNNTIRAALAATAIGVAAIATAPTASAGATAHTEVIWGGGDECILAQGPSIANPYLLSLPTLQCSFSHVLAWDERRGPGQLIGVDPIMGDAEWISCSIVVDGSLLYTDFAVAGDDTDVTCLRVVTA